MARVSDFFKEARRRRVFWGAALYIVAAWIVLQVADHAFEAWGVLDQDLRYIWIGAFLGFPFALIFA